MSELGSHMTPAKTSDETTSRKRKLWHLERPHLYWPWWVMLTMVVMVALAASYFMGMLSTLSSAHSLLTSLHNQLNAVDREKARLGREAQLLGVLQSLRTGHWDSPLAWLILAPQALWLGIGLVVGVGVSAVFHRRRYKALKTASSNTRYSESFTSPNTRQSESFTSPPPPPADPPYSHSYTQNSPTTEQGCKARSTGPQWLKEFVGLVLWVIVVAGLAFVIVHVALVWGSNFPAHFSNFSRLF